MIEQLWCLLDIALAALLGFLIGLERTLRSKEAGVRTHTIVCFASALFMVVSKLAFSEFGNTDASRVAAQIIPGIGFLCAGIIVYRKNAVHGLTTAAGVWATAGVGMACGGGLYIVATVASVVLIGLQALLNAKKGFLSARQQYRLNIAFRKENDEDVKLKEIFNVEHFYKFHTSRLDDKILCEATLLTEKKYTSEQLNEFMCQYPFIVSIERVDIE